jgi:hypothetical protein
MLLSIAVTLKIERSERAKSEKNVVFLVATAQLSVANLVKTPILHET